MFLLLKVLFGFLGFGEKNPNYTKVVKPKVELFLQEKDYHYTDTKFSLNRAGTSFAYQKTDIYNTNINQIISVLDPVSRHELANFTFHPPASTYRLEQLSWDDQDVLWLSVMNYLDKSKSLPDSCVQAYSYHAGQSSFTERTCSDVPTHVWAVRTDASVSSWFDKLPQGSDLPFSFNKVDDPGGQQAVYKLSLDKTYYAVDVSERYAGGPAGFFGNRDIRILDARGKFVEQLADMGVIGWLPDGSLLTQADPRGGYTKKFAIVRISRSELERLKKTYAK